jgi:hypothetical protein
MLPVRKRGGPGKEVPPERARTNHKKKGTVRYWELPKKTRRPASTKWNASARHRLRGHANAAVHSGRMKRRKFYRNRPGLTQQSCRQPPFCNRALLPNTQPQSRNISR